MSEKGEKRMKEINKKKDIIWKAIRRAKISKYQDSQGCIECYSMNMSISMTYMSVPYYSSYTMCPICQDLQFNTTPW